jgi:hypothetical protein
LKTRLKATRFANDLAAWRSKSAQSPAVLLEHEFAQEKASALAALARFDAEHLRAAPSAERRQLHAALVAQASDALRHFVVQRQVCGLRDLPHVLRNDRVPPEVAARLGALPNAPARPLGRARGHKK